MQVTEGCKRSRCTKHMLTVAFSKLQAPRVIPAIFDKTAPNSQDECPGYKASNVVTSTTGLTADLTLAGKPCNSFGFDVQDLILSVGKHHRRTVACYKDTG